MSAPQIVVGASDHYARAELVILGIEAARPVLLERREIPLIQRGLPSAPYHHEALELDFDAAADLVDQVRESVGKCAREGLQQVVDDLGVQALIVQTSPFDFLPYDLAAVHASRSLTHAADGMLYREALAEAAEYVGLEVYRYPRKKDPMHLAAQAMGCELAEVQALIEEFGQQAGTPWRKDHRQAAAAALSILAPTRS